MPEHMIPPMKKAYLVDLEICKCYKPVKIFESDSKNYLSGQVVDVCMCDPRFYATEFCGYRKHTQRVTVSEIEKGGTLEIKVERAICEKRQKFKELEILLKKYNEYNGFV